MSFSYVKSRQVFVLPKLHCKKFLFTAWNNNKARDVEEELRDRFLYKTY